jgi:hypothetical protein
MNIKTSPLLRVVFDSLQQRYGERGHVIGYMSNNFPVIPAKHAVCGAAGIEIGSFFPAMIFQGNRQKVSGIFAGNFMDFRHLKRVWRLS